MPSSTVPTVYRSPLRATLFKAVLKKKLYYEDRKSSSWQEAQQVTKTQGLKDWWFTFKSSIHIPKKLTSSVSDLLKSKQQYDATAPSRANTTLKPILKKREAVFQSDFDIPDAADLYYASQLSMPKLSSMPVPWVHSYPAPVGYYSLDNFHMREPMYSPAPMAAPNVPKKQTSLAWNEEVEVIPALSGSKYNRKPLANATYMNLTSDLKSAIRDELNYYKMHEMVVHELSMNHTVFH
ncbi:unnamed protein product [Umbelopsis vinacea]